MLMPKVGNFYRAKNKPEEKLVYFGNIGPISGEFWYHFAHAVYPDLVYYRVKDCDLDLFEDWEEKSTSLTSHCLACEMREKAIAQKPSQEVPQAYLDWIKTKSRSAGVSGNEAWNAAIEWYKNSQGTPKCQYCDDTGEVTDVTGEWRGTCICEAGKMKKEEN